MFNNGYPPTIQLAKSHGAYLIINSHDPKNDILIQTDWDFPSTARTFGWDMREVQVMNAHYYGVVCEHRSTDGTVTCNECGLKPTTFINAAREYLDAHLGEVVAAGV